MFGSGVRQAWDNPDTDKKDGTRQTGVQETHLWDNSETNKKGRTQQIGDQETQRRDNSETGNTKHNDVQETQH